MENPAAGTIFAVCQEGSKLADVRSGKARSSHDRPDAFAHEALLYAGGDGFVAGTLPFVRAGLEADEAVLVAVPRDNADRLREALGGAAEDVLFADMAELGRNPGRIIPAWRDFLERYSAAGRGVRGIGEPVWAQRTEDELSECQRHEALLNLAFGPTPAWTLLCPYDVDALRDDVIVEAYRSHPVVREDGRSFESLAYVDPRESLGGYDDDLPAPAEPPACITFGRNEVAAVRALAARYAQAAGLSDQSAADLVLAASEAATNSVLHGGGEGTFGVWHDDGAVVCEVRDRGHIEDLLAGRRRPSLDAVDGRGLWVVHQLCDLVEVRSLPEGTAVRFRIAPR